jgi:hypothetical protein
MLEIRKFLTPSQPGSAVAEFTNEGGKNHFSQTSQKFQHQKRSRRFLNKRKCRFNIYTLDLNEASQKKNHQRVHTLDFTTYSSDENCILLS